MNEEKKYTAEDFERYHSGGMSPADMHALERAALHDPFLSDALEGYSLRLHTPEDLVVLRRTLAVKSNKRERYLSGRIRNLWWQIAASVIVLLGIGYLIFQKNEPGREDALASRALTERNTADTFSRINDSVSAENDLAVNTQPVAPASSPVAEAEKLQKRQYPTAAPPLVQNRSMDVEQEQVAKAESMDDVKQQPSILMSRAPGGTPATTDFEYTGKVTDGAGNTIPFASIRPLNERKVMVTDAEGTFRFHGQDSTINAEVYAVGFDKSVVQLANKSRTTLQLSPSSSTFDEVVVTGNGNEQLKEKKTAQIAGRNNSQTDRLAPTKSFGSSEEFDDYVEENQLPVFDASEQELSGDVELSFNVNSEGEPENIVVSHSSCRGCESQAIYLLKNGPKWGKQKNKAGTVRLTF